jgi:hypothetical protein
MLHSSREFLVGRARASERRRAGLFDLVRILLSACLLASPASAGAEATTGRVVGRVFDSETGDPLQGVTAILLWPAPADGSGIILVDVTYTRINKRLDDFPCIICRSVINDNHLMGMVRLI